MMTMSVSEQIGKAGYSWSPNGKDRNSDGKVSREEFKMPVMEGYGGLAPADLRAGGSLDDAFDAYDSNKDGYIDRRELTSGPKASASTRPADRFYSNWGDTMTTEQALAYFNVINADNARLAKEWGMDLSDLNDGNGSPIGLADLQRLAGENTPFSNRFRAYG